jgi:hypothetical protein
MKAFVICRDRVTYARQCVDALLAVGLEVVIVDHGSTWPPMRDWLWAWATYGEAKVRVELGDNRHPRDLWRPGGPIAAVVGEHERFIVTDCDVIPDPDCPREWVGWMSVTLDRYPALRKVGLGLRTDDLPEHYEHRDAVRHWEAQYQAVEDGGRLGAVKDGRGVIADVDTTLAMYRRYEPFALGPAMRLRAPYVARHLAWYENTAALTAEQRYYREHAVHGHWRAPHEYADTHGLGGTD